MPNNTLYIFLDESGNLDFSPKGTKYFSLTCISTLDPLTKREGFPALKYTLLGDGIEQEYFHASEDKQIVRDGVFNLISGLDDFQIDTVIAQKNKANFALFEQISAVQTGNSLKFKKEKVEEKFYKMICETLLKYVITRYVRKGGITKVIVILDACFVKKKQEYVTKYLKQYFKKEFGKVPYVYFQQVKADVNCQIADYCGWGIFIKWERGELRSYDVIKSKIKSEFDIFIRGTKTYY
jgi:hypothetical protein